MVIMTATSRILATPFNSMCVKRNAMYMQNSYITRVEWRPDAQATRLFKQLVPVHSNEESSPHHIPVWGEYTGHPISSMKIVIRACDIEDEPTVTYPSWVLLHSPGQLLLKCSISYFKSPTFNWNHTSSIKLTGLYQWPPSWMDGRSCEQHSVNL